MNRARLWDAVRAAYNYAEHLPEWRRMMQAWADYVDGLKNGAEVVLLHGRSAGPACDFSKGTQMRSSE